MLWVPRENAGWLGGASVPLRMRTVPFGDIGEKELPPPTPRATSPGRGSLGGETPP